jgi:hypothetical protein
MYTVLTLGIWWFIENYFLALVLWDCQYLGATPTSQNCIHDKIKNRLNCGSACFRSVQILLSSSLLSENIKIKIYRTMVLSVVLYGHETWSLTLREEHRLKVFENRVLRNIFGSERDEVTGVWRRLKRSFMSYNPPQIFFG